MICTPEYPTLSFVIKLQQKTVEYCTYEIQLVSNYTAVV